MLIRADQLSLHRAGKSLFEDARLEVQPGDRIGVVGANGTGKSSLFALIRGELEPDTGVFELNTAARLSWARQDTPALEISALDQVLDGDQDLRAAQQALIAAESQSDGLLIGECHAQLAAVQAYDAPARAAVLLNALGFEAGDIERHVASFSGGWRMRLNLAQAIFAPSDVLLLDEPTNHLDLEAVVELEQILARHPAAVILIAHDREFLDRVVNRIWYFDGRSIQVHNGNYTDFERRRAEQLSVERASAEKQARTRAHMETFINRFRAQATKARQVQSRIKALARLGEARAAEVDRVLDFELPGEAKAPRPLFAANKVRLGYGEQTILEAVDFQLQPGDRIGLVGRNGQGKSTLIKALAGRLEPLSGELTAGIGLKVAHFAQHQVDEQDPEDTPLGMLKRQDPQASEQILRNHLGGWGFAGDLALTPLGQRSGGQRSRLALAAIAWRRPNLLLLDEPTNHLDLSTRDALAEALIDYPGALVLVSHDRGLIRACCDQLWWVHEGKLERLDEDLDDYLKRLQEADRQRNASATAAPTAAPPPRPAARADKERLKQLRRELRQSEQALERSGKALGEVAEQLADPQFWQQKSATEASRVQRQQAELQAQLAEAERAWMAAAEALEQAEGA